MHGRLVYAQVLPADPAREPVGSSEYTSNAIPNDAQPAYYAQVSALQPDLMPTSGGRGGCARPGSGLALRPL